MNVAALVGEALAGIDLDDAARRYVAQGEFLFLERVLPAELTSALAEESAALRALATHNHLPFVRSAGTVVHSIVRERAPLLVAAYRSPPLLGFLARLGAAAGRSPNADREATAHLYYYNRPGDWMRDHHDACSRCDLAAQTIIFGLIDRSTQRLRCHVMGEDLHLCTGPGSLVVFNTARTRHGVSPLGAGEERVVACASYTAPRAASPLSRSLSALQESLLFHGPFGPPRAILRALGRRLRPEEP